MPAQHLALAVLGPDPQVIAETAAREDVSRSSPTFMAEERYRSSPRIDTASVPDSACHQRANVTSSAVQGLFEKLLDGAFKHTRKEGCVRR